MALEHLHFLAALGLYPGGQQDEYFAANEILRDDDMGGIANWPDLSHEHLLNPGIQTELRRPELFGHDRKKRAGI